MRLPLSLEAVNTTVSTGNDKGLSSSGRVLGCGALQVCDHCLFEDGGEHGGALLSDHIPFKAASEGQD